MLGSFPNSFPVYSILESLGESIEHTGTLRTVKYRMSPIEARVRRAQNSTPHRFGTTGQPWLYRSSRVSHVNMINTSPRSKIGFLSKSRKAVHAYIHKGCITLTIKHILSWRAYSMQGSINRAHSSSFRERERKKITGIIVICFNRSPTSYTLF